MAISSQAMLPIAATVYGEASNQDYKTKVKIASTILNRFESGKKEFGADTGNMSDVLHKGYDSARDSSPQFKQAMLGDFPDKDSENSYKESLGIVSGLLKGVIPREKGEFAMTDKGVANVKKKNLMDMNKVENLGKSGSFNFFGYPSKKAAGKALKP